ncbi:MAG TPA: Hsp33 family molecular chaperone HslO [Rhodocyclaceae bacterium]|jgi:molecular chaperone Hsp33|nr:Hsp33 family molecular chaperone HslO [Betaproteobacteria bacterium]HMV00877.1 Hsp33 family molecular chaperone HslO [Rhodocyclaceae bacterium]HMV21608.1 Hsp33 family molecular chaperone HslO [Rhodocyclaceae bacterium]HMW76373.1 Hsp33 family molecular chaperone HslO [Rhodocyclaceae bacterium]HNL21233.1 Hsp33 family molecular chaperone HslO [Rhodocyclaceae bacterium]
MTDSVRRFLFESLDIRGAFVQMDQSWRQMQAGRDYPTPVCGLLGELAAVTALIAAQLKQPGRITLQLRGAGPIRLLVVDCDDELRLRGMAHCPEVVLPDSAPFLLGAGQGGQLMMSLDLPTAQQPYQSFVPLVGQTIAEIFQHFLEQSEQQPSRLFLAATEEGAACLFLQKLPDADHRDPDGWTRLCHLASTVKPLELLALDAKTLLNRLFHEDMGDSFRLYDPVPVSYHCPEDWEKVRRVIRSLGRDEAEALVRERGSIVLRDDLCNREYRFGPEEVAALFDPGETPTLH